VPVTRPLITVLRVTDLVRTAAFVELDPTALYELLRLRSEVFVVEQQCAFLDLDGRDTEPTAIHLWLERDGRMVGYARILPGPDDTELGRVVTPLDQRGTGLGARLMREAIARIDGPIRLKAQARLAEWYERFGFEVIDQPFLEDGIPHVPMRFDP
jgi:ElaA protein